MSDFTPVLLLQGESTAEPTPVWPTPTPRPPVEATPAINLEDFDAAFTEMAEEGVQTWNVANEYGGIDVVMSILIAILLFLMARDIMRRIRDL